MREIKTEWAVLSPMGIQAPDAWLQYNNDKLVAMFRPIYDKMRAKHLKAVAKDIKS